MPKLDPLTAYTIATEEIKIEDFLATAPEPYIIMIRREQLSKNTATQFSVVNYFTLEMIQNLGLNVLDECLTYSIRSYILEGKQL